MTTNNNYGIGICLVGNFELTSPTPRQMIALQSLVRALMGRYHIAPEKIFSHRQVRPKPTRCPGDRFPIKRLLRAVSAPYQFLCIPKLVGDTPDSAYNFPASRSSFTCSSWISTPSAYSVAICSSV